MLGVVCAGSGFSGQQKVDEKKTTNVEKENFNCSLDGNKIYVSMKPRTFLDLTERERHQKRRIPRIHPVASKK